MDIEEAVQNGLEEIKGRSKNNLLDPSQIKVVNWSRKRKRNKKLWKTTRGRGRGPVVASISAEELGGLL